MNDADLRHSPNRPRTAFQLFSVHKRAEVMAANPPMSSTDIFNEVSRLWKGGGSDNKKVYEQLAEDDRQQYERELEQYVLAKQQRLAAATAAARRSLHR